MWFRDTYTVFQEPKTAHPKALHTMNLICFKPAWLGSAWLNMNFIFCVFFQAIEVKTYRLGRTCSNLRRLSWASISAMVQFWDWRNKSYWSALYPTQTTSTHCGSNHLHLVSVFFLQTILCSIYIFFQASASRWMF